MLIQPVAATNKGIAYSWAERWALDISADLAEIIENSWARETPIPPYHIYLNIAYHLSTEARAGLSQFRLPGRFENELFEFQKSAVGR